MRKRGQLAQGYVLLAVWWVPVWPFVPDTSPTINCFIQLECVSFLTAHGVCTSKGMKGWRNGVEVTFTKQVSIPVIYIRFTFAWILITQVVSSYANFLEQKKLFYKRKDFNSTGRLFNLFCSPMWPPRRHMKTLYGLNIAHFLFTVTLGARGFSARFPVLISLKKWPGRRPKTSRPAADEAPRSTREKISGPQGTLLYEID